MKVKTTKNGSDEAAKIIFNNEKNEIDDQITIKKARGLCDSMV